MKQLFHGDNIVASRQALNDLKDSFKGGVVVLDGKSLDITTFVQATSSDSIFGTTKLVLVENYFTSIKKPRPEIINSNADILFWEGKKLTPTVLNQLDSFRIREFKVEAVIFKFVDALRPNGGKSLLFLFDRCLATSEPEFIFAMIIRQFRLMLEGSRPFQAKLFGGDRLKLIYQRLLDLDYKNKQSLLVGNLGANVKEFLLWI